MNCTKQKLTSSVITAGVFCCWCCFCFVIVVLGWIFIINKAPQIVSFFIILFRGRILNNRTCMDENKLSIPYTRTCICMTTRILKYSYIGYASKMVSYRAIITYFSWHFCKAHLCFYKSLATKCMLASPNFSQVLCPSNCKTMKELFLCFCSFISVLNFG